MESEDFCLIPDPGRSFFCSAKVVARSSCEVSAFGCARTCSLDLGAALAGSWIPPNAMISSQDGLVGRDDDLLPIGKENPMAPFM
jgi:hypothetical protein